MTPLLRALEWLGRNARWTLVVGIFGAMLFQELGAILRPALPFFVAMVYTLAMIRIDLFDTVRNALKPERALRTLLVSIAVIVATPVLLYGVAKIIHLDTQLTAALVYAHAAPPIASSAGICLIMGLNAVFALEISIIASLLTPLIGPVVVLMLLGDHVPLDGWSLALRLALIIAGGASAALLIRNSLGAETIQRHSTVFDGITALGMLVFLLPVFDGVTAAIMNNPIFSLGVLVLAIIPNFGLQIAAFLVAKPVTSHPTAGAAGVIWGNRNLTLFLASVPESPVFSLYVALYQFPMYFTPLVMRRIFKSYP